MTNVKYTLYADIGRVLCSGTHYLHIGSWMQLDQSKFVVLVHGTMSREAYNSICTRLLLPIYEYAPVSWIDIFPYHDTGFFQSQKIGRLIKVKDLDLWKGELYHGNRTYILD